ncbi:MAG: hypothetical protein WAZ12_02820 [Candidatus Absconditicoccaceae bacterium]
MGLKLAILFWFYKDLDVCENRLQLLKKHNPDSKIYGLFGGPKSQENKFKKKLNKYLDNFYTTPEKNSFKKWIHGDLYLLDRYQKRGRKLEWDSIIIAQRDLLIFQPIKDIFKGIKKDEIFLPHHDLITKKVESDWHWTSSQQFKQTDNNKKTKAHMRGNYLEFKKYIKKEYGFKSTLPRTIFMTAILPRIFFEKYQTVKEIEIGFLEYKIPTYTKIFKIKRFKKYLGEKIIPVDKCPMNADAIEIKKEYISSQLKRKNGRRVFHPYYKIY